MYLEVKKRIANHPSTKPRGKVIKLKPSRKPVAQPVDESSIIYISSSPSSRASSPAPVVSKQKEKQKKAPVEKNKTKTKGKKEKPLPMTPADYARMLQAKLAAAASRDADPSTSKPIPKRKASTVKFLEGKHIFYTGGDRTHASETTRGRMDIVRFF